MELVSPRFNIHAAKTKKRVLWNRLHGTSPFYWPRIPGGGALRPGVVTCESGGKGSGYDVTCLWPDEKEMRAARVGEKGTRLAGEVG